MVDKWHGSSEAPYNFSSKWDWGRCTLEELRDWEQAKDKRKIERVRENCEKYIVKKRVMSENKRKFFLCSNCISKCCNFYLI